MKQRTIYTTIMIGGAAGMVAAFLQLTEKITLLKNKDAILACDLNSVFSCTNVLNAWQSSVFGFPNSILCLALFTIFSTVAVAGATGGKLSKGMRVGTQAISLMTLGFALWFLFQSIYVISSLCILCIFCFVGLLLVNWGWLRINAQDLPLGQRGRDLLQRAIRTGADIFGWTVVGLVVLFAMLIKFY